MEPNESGLSSYYHQHQHQHQQPSSTLSPTPTPTASSPATNGLHDGAANAAALYPQSVAGKAPAAVVASVEPPKRKRGRPRKYGTPEAAAAAKRAYVPAAAVKRKEQHFLGGCSSSSKRSPHFVSLGGQGFTPHVINVAAGEDIGQKIMLFMQQSRRELCILSASGSISSASLRQPATSGGSIAYQGCYDIISLTGSYICSDHGRKAGGLSTCLVSTNDGQIVGGSVGGPLIAAGPVEIIVATFVIDPKKDTSAAGFKGDASACRMSSPVSATTPVYKPVVESSGGFTVTGSDNHHNMNGSSFMMQPQWRGGIDYDLAGNTGHDSHDSPENGDYEHMPD